MTANELMTYLLACGPQSLSVTLHYIADRWCELTLANGQRLSEATDSKAALIELAIAARFPDRLARSKENKCPDCDHEHEGRTECSKYLGEGKFCQCESKVPA